MLLLSWIASGGGRSIVTLDLLHCTEVHLVPSPMHVSALEDVGTIAAIAQSTGHEGLIWMEALCSFSCCRDGVKRLAVESVRERVRWVSEGKGSGL